MLRARLLFLVSLTQKHRLELPPLEGSVHRVPDAGEIRHQRAGLFDWVILTERYKSVIPLKADSSPYPIQPTNL